MTGFIDVFFYNLSCSQSIIALPLIYPLHKSLGHAKPSQSSLVTSWQRIYKSPCHCSTHQVFFSQVNSVVLRSTPFHSFNSHSHSSDSVVLLTPSVLILPLWIPPRGGPHGKHRLSTIRKGVYPSVAFKWTSFYCWERNFWTVYQPVA
jgi:hypothetical protein